jgi:plasmid stabilization system protein ParE
MIPVRYHEAAEDELLNEIGYLELRLQVLGRRFYGEVQRAEKRLSEFPESGLEVLPGIRKHNLRKFPFSLIYSIEKDGLLILAVAHQRRRPQYWLPRIS